ncbi:class I SAM-dependent methyltransferase [Duganella qianjiadongensis]|uniref:Methyltransferase n=1 Tax=Duganella qianjiadongensis TaxID=2692176 RepID=A0ABW9VII3_9BURK|nr:class I SAM-dependent methyltransferase [Duganella qianjiadongensis]MYM38685.1 methyltransferase [Duganella qianjiadongensis]
MTDWTSGYVATIGYTYGYYAELNSLHMRLAFLQAGIALPQIGTACELGFGQGVSTNFHAAATPTRWFGTDFNPSQAGYAQSLSLASGATTGLYDQGFDEFCQRSDLPDFDFIVLHGIWSWVSDENRSIIVDFIRRKLKVGGVLYISYNTQPGWATMVPMRDLLITHSEVMGNAAQGLVPRIDDALAFTDKLMATQPRFAKVNPLVGKRLAELKSQDRHYLAHEYFNRDWLPMPFSRMAEWMTPAKLDFVCSANYMEHIDELNLNPEQQELLQQINHPVFRETVRDFCVNQQFRRDYWIKGARKLSPLKQIEQARAQAVVLTKPRSGISLKIATHQGEATMQEAVYGPLLDYLADYQVRTLGQIEQHLRPLNIELPQIIQASLILGGIGALSAAQSSPPDAQSLKQTQQLNAYLCREACSGSEITFLASPVTGGGIAVSSVHQIFIHALLEGHASPEGWASVAWQALQQLGRCVLRDGKALVSAEENLSELCEQAAHFAQQQLPLLRALQVV